MLGEWPPKHRNGCGATYVRRRWRIDDAGVARPGTPPSHLTSGEIRSFPDENKRPRISISATIPTKDSMEAPGRLVSDRMLHPYQTKLGYVMQHLALWSHHQRVYHSLGKTGFM